MVASRMPPKKSVIVEKTSVQNNKEKRDERANGKRPVEMLEEYRDDDSDDDYNERSDDLDEEDGKMGDDSEDENGEAEEVEDGEEEEGEEEDEEDDQKGKENGEEEEDERRMTQIDKIDQESAEKPQEGGEEIDSDAEDEENSGQQNLVMEMVERDATLYSAYPFDWVTKVKPTDENGTTYAVPKEAVLHHPKYVIALNNDAYHYMRSLTEPKQIQDFCDCIFNDTEEAIKRPEEFNPGCFGALVVKVATLNKKKKPVSVRYASVFFVSIVNADRERGSEDDAPPFVVPIPNDYTQCIDEKADKCMLQTKSQGGYKSDLKAEEVVMVHESANMRGDVEVPFSLNKAAIKLVLREAVTKKEKANLAKKANKPDKKPRPSKTKQSPMTQTTLSASTPAPATEQEPKADDKSQEKPKKNKRSVEATQHAASTSQDTHVECVDSECVNVVKKRFVVRGADKIISFKQYVVDNDVHYEVEMRVED